MMSIKLSSGLARAWWIVAVAAAVAPPHARPQEPSAAILEPGVPIDRELSGAQADVYRLALAKDQYAAAIVEQRGIDVVVQLMDPAGKQIAEFDAESRRQGQELV